MSEGAAGAAAHAAVGELGMGFVHREDSDVRAERCGPADGRRSIHPPAGPDGRHTAFDGIDFGANAGGIYTAAGPDRMHVMLEGLGKNIASWTCTLAEGHGTEAELDQRS